MNRPIDTWAKAHLAMDVVMCGALLLSPFFLPRSRRRYAAIPMLLGGAGLLTSMMTQMESTADSGFRPTRELSEAVADPDNARAPHLHLHLD